MSITVAVRDLAARLVLTTAAFSLIAAIAGCNDDPGNGGVDMDAGVGDQGVGEPAVECVMPDPPVEGVPQCQCANEADNAIIQADVSAVEDVAAQCALDNLGDADFDNLVDQCIVDATGLSVDCAFCYREEQINCSIVNCLPACLEPSSDACRDCQRDFCDDAYDTCNGVTF